jgi:carboxylesterase
MLHSRLARFGAGSAGAIALWLAAAPVPSGPTPAPPSPARDYAEAVARYQRVRAAEDSTVNGDCLPRLLTHGGRTERAVVLLHGFTNCPKQFDSLAALLYSRGFNVYLPRMPRHGLADRMTTALAGLTAEDLVGAAESALDLAHGLGERVTVVGLSSTAVAAAWLAAHREDLDEAVVIAPALSPKGVSLLWTKRLTSTLLVAPNFFAWWNSELKERVPGPRQCYPRFPSRGLAQVYRLGFAVLDDAAREKPAARRVAVLTTASDEGVGNEAARELARRWRARGGDVRTVEFPASLGVHHDMIDPAQPYQRIGIAYPEIGRLIGG